MSSPKKSKSRAKANSLRALPVRFALSHQPAQEVFLAGSFNNWEPTRLQRSDAESSHWEIELPLPPGAHEYLFIVDGRWVPDPTNPHAVPNPFGGRNSVVEVTSLPAH